MKHLSIAKRDTVPPNRRMLRSLSDPPARAGRSGILGLTGAEWIRLSIFGSFERAFQRWTLVTPSGPGKCLNSPCGGNFHVFEAAETGPPNQISRMVLQTVPIRLRTSRQPSLSARAMSLSCARGLRLFFFSAVLCGFNRRGWKEVTALEPGECIWPSGTTNAGRFDRYSNDEAANGSSAVASTPLASSGRSLPYSEPAVCIREFGSTGSMATPKSWIVQRKTSDDKASGRR